MVDYAFWNTFHDGRIEGVAGDVPGDIVLTVSIAYLCGQLPTAAASVRVLLRGCSVFSYTPHGGSTMTCIEALDGADMEILSANDHGDRVTVCCVGGTLVAAYRGVEIRLMEEALVSQAELEAAAERYWKAWSGRNNAS